MFAEWTVLNTRERHVKNAESFIVNQVMYYTVTLFWMICAKINYAGQINFDVLMVLHQRILFEFIDSAGPGISYMV